MPHENFKLHLAESIFMKSFTPTLLTILIILFSINGAEASEYDWILRESKKTDVTGNIDGKQYIARITNGINSEEEVNMIILISSLYREKQELVAVIDLQGDYASSYKVKIKNDSIYISHSTAHHGVYFSRYQFKKNGKEFQLVGIESQSMTSSDYGVDEKERSKPSYKSLEMWSGTSINLLTAEGECWLQRFPWDDKEGKIAMARFENELPSTKGVRRKVKFNLAKHFPLNNFDFYNDNLRNLVTCYFDYHMRFHSK